MTEEEAKKKWCPFIRYGATPDEWHINRPSFMVSPVKGHDLCIASDCMAWRNEIELVEDDEGLSLKEPADGYCGLAGKP